MRNIWDFRRKYGCILGYSLYHYRCQLVAPKDTKAVQISDTPEYRHHYLKQPTLTPEDRFLRGFQTLTCLLEDVPIQMCDEQLHAISTLQELFGQWTKNVPTYPRQNKSPRVQPNKPPGKERPKPKIQKGSKTTDHLTPPPTQAPRVQVMQTAPHSDPRVDIIPPPDTKNNT